MRKIDEMNTLEIEGARACLKRDGWNPCSIGTENIKGWSKGRITIEEKDIWFEED